MTKLVKQNSFGIRIVTIWNNLLEHVVNPLNVNTFKDRLRLHKHWENQKFCLITDQNEKITTGTSEIQIGKRK